MAFDRTTLRAHARVLADQDASDFPTDAHYNLYLDDAKRDVWADLVTAGWPVNYATQVITASGASQYVIAAGASVFAVQGVFYVQGASRSPLPRIMDRSDAPTQAQFAAGYEIRTDMTLGTVIRLYPAAAGGTYEVDYVAEPAGFANDADTWNGPARTDRLIVLRAAADACRKEGRRQDADAMLQEYGAVLDKVKATATWVDSKNPARIRDVGSAILRDTFDYDIARGSY